MVPKIEAYHKRSLSDKFFCVYLDATYLPLRRQTFEREAVYIAIGIKPNGCKEVIDYCIAPNENIEVWTEMLQNIKSRGLKPVISTFILRSEFIQCTHSKTCADYVHYFSLYKKINLNLSS